MAKRRAGSQIANLTPDHKKPRIDPIYLASGGRATYRWKALDKSYNFALDLITIRGLLAKFWGSKVAEIHLARFQDSHSGVPGKIAIWM